MNEFRRTTMSDEDLCLAVLSWVSDLCHGRREWVMRVPVDLDRDPDVLISELVRRFRDLATTATEPTDER